MKKIISTILIIMCIISCIPKTDAIHVNLDDVYFLVGNEKYNCSDMDFSSITIGSDYIVFNTTGFYIDAPNDINITLHYLNSSMDGSELDRLLNFTVNTSSGLVYFNISGFIKDNNYTINRTGNWFTNDTANSTGFINWTYNDWALGHYFEVFIKKITTGATLFIQKARENMSIILAYGGFILPIGLIVKKHKRRKK